MCYTNLRTDTDCAHWQQCTRDYTLYSYAHLLKIGARVIFQHGCDVFQRRVPLHQRLGVGGRATQCQRVVFVQSLVDVQNVRARTVHLVGRLAAGDQRTQVLVVQLQESAHDDDDDNSQSINK